MRKINGKLFLILLVGVVALTGTVVLIHHFQYKRIARALLWQARRAEEQGQVARTARYLQRYLEFNPRDTAEKANLARLWASDAYAGQVRQRQHAAWLLDEVLTFEDDPELRKLLVKVAMELRNTKMARDHLEKLLPWKDLEGWIKEDTAARAKGGAQPAHLAKEDKAKGELESFWGQILESEQKRIEAINCYRLATRHAPEGQLSYIRLAYLLRRLSESDPVKKKQNQDEADKVMDDLVTNNDSVHASFLARWRYRREFDMMAIRETANKGQVNLEAAAEDVAAALKRKPNAVEVLLAAADLERLRGRSAAEDPTRTPERRLRAMESHRKKAFDYLTKGLDTISRSKDAIDETGKFQLLWHKANLLLDDLDYQQLLRDEQKGSLSKRESLKSQIADVIEQVRKSRVPASADYLKGRLLVHDRNWSRATVCFERARALLAPQPDLAAQANLYLGLCYERLENHAQMFDAYKRVAEWDPNSVPAILGMAAARWAQGQTDNALALYKRVMRQNKVPPRGWIDIARLEMQKQATAEKPDWTNVELALKRAGQLKGVPPVDIVLLQAELLLRQGKQAEAVKTIEQARDKQPKQVEFWAALADLALREKKPSRARQILDDAQEKLGDNVSLRLTEARYFAQATGKDSKEKIAKLAEGLKKFSAEDQARLINGLAETSFGAGHGDQARKLWQQMAKLPTQRNDLRLRLLLFDLAMRDKDENGMTDVLNDIKGIEQTGGVYSGYGRALLLIWKAKNKLQGGARTTALKQARAELDRVIGQRPNWSAVFLARAEIAELNGKPDEAIKDLDAAVKNGETGASVARRLVALLSQHDRNTEAQAVLARLQQTVRANADLQRMAVNVAVRGGNMNQAMEMARRMVRDDSTDPRELVWMAGVLTVAGKFADAEKKIDEAIKLAPAEPGPWLARVQFLVARKRLTEAREAIGKAKDSIAADKLNLALAQCYDAVRDQTRAQEYYAKALKSSKNDAAIVKTVASVHLRQGRAKEAENLLRPFIDGTVKNVKAADLAWGKRALAMLLANGTDYKRFTEALKLVGLELDANGKLPGTSSNDLATEDLRAQARVLGSQNQRQFRVRAIAILEQLNRNKALNPDDKYVLALLYAAEGKKRDSETNLRELANLTRPRTPQYLAQYALSLLLEKRKDRLNEAEKVIGWLKQIEKDREAEPNTFATVDLEARLLEAKGKPDEAIALLKKHIERPKAKPEEVLLMLGALSRQMKFKEAFALCEKVWETAGQKDGCSPEAVGGVSVALLRVMNKPAPTDAQVKKVETYLRQAMKDRPKSVALKMHLADLHDRRGQYDDATKLYRQVIEIEPNNIVALNNLAWMLALRSGDADEALKHINKAVAGMGRRADLLDTRGLVHLARKETAKALADFDEAAKDAPTAVRLYHLAWAHHLERDRTKAREALARALEKGLQVSAIHPVEAAECKKLLAEYGLSKKR